MKRAKQVFGRIKPWLGVLFLCLMLWLLARQLTGIKWRDVATNLTEIPWYVLASMVLCTVVSYAIFSYYDVRSVKALGKKFSYAQMFAPAFVSYAANFNFGGIIGAVGMRVKLYSDLGLKAAQIGAVVALSTIGNWLGYLLFGGVFLVLSPPAFTANEYLVQVPWRAVGGGMLALLVTAFAVFYATGPREIERFRLQLPGARESLIRCAFAVVNWIAVTSVLLCIFSWHFKAPIQPVVAAYIVSAVAGAMIHVPGGVGVFETVFLAGLREYLPVEAIMAGLLTFRALYYLVPLLAALPCWLWFQLQLDNDKATRASPRPVEETA